MGDTDANDPIRLESVTIQAERVTVTGVPPASSPEEIKRYQINAGMFAGLMVLLTIWFKAHLETYLTQLTIVGTVTGIAVIQMIASWFPDKKEKPEEIRRRWLARPGVRGQLQVAIVIAMLLLLVTKSVYVKLGKTDETKVLIDIRDSAGKTLEKLRLDADHTTAGGPFFALCPPTWNLVVAQPRGYDKHPVKFGVLGSEAVTFPFEPTQLHILRILARIADQQFLPNCPAQPPSATVYLTIDGKKEPVTGFCQYGILYVGATEKDIRKIIKRHEADFETEYVDHLLQAQITGDASRMLLGLVRGNAKIHPTSELREGQQVTITIEYGMFTKTSHHVVSDDEIQTIYVGDPE